MKRTLRFSRAFSLVEATLALRVASIALIAIFGLLASGTQVQHTAIEQNSSSDILTTVAADLRATPKTSTNSPQFNITIGADTTLYFNSVGQASPTRVADSRYQLKIKFPPKGGGRTATFVHLRMTWPAVADPARANTSAAETFVALDRN